MLEKDGCKNTSVFQGPLMLKHCSPPNPYKSPFFKIQLLYSRLFAPHSTAGILSPYEYTHVGVWQAGLVQRNAGSSSQTFPTPLLLPQTSLEIWGSKVGKRSLWEQDDPSKMFAWLAVSWMSCKYRWPDSRDPSRALHLCSFKRDTESCPVLGVGVGGLM